MSERFFKRLDEIDAIVGSQPNEAVVRRLRNLLLEMSSELYLFKVIPPTWLPYLESDGWFHNPPEPQTDSHGTRVVRWPASDYLVRVTKYANDNGASHLIAAVKRVISNIPIVHNPFIFKNIIDVMLEMQVSDVADLSLVLQSWLGQQSAVWSRGVPTLIDRLLQAGFRVPSLRLIRAAFAVLPDTNFYSQPEESRTLPQAKILMRDWEYEQQLSEVLHLAGNRGESSFVVLLSQLLHDAVRFSQKDLSYQGPADTSYVWRPAVEDHAQNRDSNVKSVLVRALRDACEQLLKEEPNRLDELIEILLAQQWFIFTRIVLHLIRVSSAATIQHISEYLTNRSYFDEITVRHEYALLLKASFGRLVPEAQEKVLGFISEGPDIVSFKRGYTRWNGREPDNEQIDRYVNHWQRDWLAFIQDDLTRERKDWFASLSASTIPSQHPEFPSYMEGGSYAGPSSPISVEELGKKAPIEVLEYIRSWKPPLETTGAAKVWRSDSDSIAGLASALTAVVFNRPQAFSLIAQQFVGLEPTYVRGFLEGIFNALRKRDKVNWPSVISLCHWAARQDGETGSQDAFVDRDPSWAWTKQTVARLLQEGLVEDSNALSLDLRETVWRTIEALLNSRDVLQGDENVELGSDFDPLTRSLNTLSGSALHAAVKYALWVRHHDKVFQGISSISEFGAIVEHVLAHPDTYGLTSRAVFGQWFPWLVLIDTEWARGNVDTIFPEGEQQLSFWEAAWATYVGYCAPYDQPFELLRGKYAFAIRQLRSKSKFRPRQYKPDEHLGEHLLSFYWRGRIGLEDDGLVMTYCRTCDTESCRHGLEFIGRSLGTKQVIRIDVIERLKALFDAVINEVEHDRVKAAPLVAFGWWFSYEGLDEKWKMSRLLQVLQYTSHIDPTDSVLENLEPIAERFPLEAAEAVSMIAEGNYELWDYEYWSPKALAVLERAVSSGRTDVRSVAARAAERFGIMGRLEFRRIAALER